MSGIHAYWVASAAWVLALAAPAQIAFRDVTASVGLQFVNRYGPTLGFAPDMTTSLRDELTVMQRNLGNGAAVADYDNDGDDDVLLLGNLGQRSVLYRNELQSGALQFVDASVAAGLGGLRGLGRVAQFVDLDGDGWKDLIVLNDSGFRHGRDAPPSAIYRNRGGVFADVTRGSGFDPAGAFQGGMGLVDYDRDGLIDIYTTTWSFLQIDDYTLLEGYCRLYRNLGNFEFRDVTRLVGLGKLETNCFTPIFADFDLDGDADLYVAVDKYADVYYRNDRGRFVEDSVQVGARHVGTDMGIAPHDFDGDGDLDLFCTNITDPFGATWGGNTLLVNQIVESGQLSFVDEARARGVVDSGWGWGTDWLDVDNDGDADLYAVGGFDEFALRFTAPPIARAWVHRRADLFLNDGTGRFTGSVGTGAEVVGDARAAIAFDADRDGDRDLLVTMVAARPVLLLNETRGGGHWLDVELVGGGGVNRDAIGARMRVRAGGRVWFHEVIGGGSYLSGRPYEAHFGLGGRTVVDEVRVFWPDGTESVRTVLAVDQRVIVTHP